MLINGNIYEYTIYVPYTSTVYEYMHEYEENQR